LVVMIPATALDLNRGLVAYYSFDDIHDNVLPDDSGNGNDGVIYGAKVVDGIKGKALYFEEGDGVKLPHTVVDGKDTLTLIFWVRTIDEKICLMSGANEKEDNELLITANDIYVIVNYRQHTTGTQILCKSKINDGLWHMIAVVVSVDSTITYIDNELACISSIGSKKPFDISPNGLWLSVEQDQIGHWNSLDDCLRGTIDEVHIYNRALSDEEIKALYEQTLHPTPKPKLTLIIECDPTLKQGEIRQAKLTAENIGNADAKDVKITITSPSLGINVQKSYDVIPSKEARTITFQVSPTEAGKFKITAMAEYWDDQGNKYIETAEKVIEVEPVTFPSPTTVTSTVIKKPPIAMVGEDVKVYEGSEVILSALASYDPDGTIVSYCWIDENDVTLSNSPILRYFFPVGTHMITLKVTDNDGLSSTDTVRVTVLAKEKGKPMIVVSQSSISGEEGLYTVTITNTGDSQAYNIRVIERIPSEIVVSYVEGAMSSGSLITWNGDLKPNEQHSIKHSLKLQTDQAIIPVTVRYKDENGMEYELLTNLLVQKPTKQTIPPSTPQLPISEQTLIIITAIVVVGVVAVAVAIAMMKRKPPEIQIRE